MFRVGQIRNHLRVIRRLEVTFHFPGCYTPKSLPALSLRQTGPKGDLKSVFIDGFIFPKYYKTFIA